MKNKTVIVILSVLAVMMYTVAVINFCLGEVLNGIACVLMASSDALIAYSLYHVGQLGRLAKTTGKILVDMLTQFAKGVPATLTVKDGKGTLTLGHDEDEDEDGETPEEQLTDDEKRVKRMAEEYDELTDRYLKLTHFLMTDTFEQLPENKQNLLKQQHQAMKDYRHILYQRLRIEAKEANLDVDIKEPDTYKAPDHE